MGTLNVKVVFLYTNNGVANLVHLNLHEEKDTKIILFARKLTNHLNQKLSGISLSSFLNRLAFEKGCGTVYS